MASYSLSGSLSEYKFNANPSLDGRASETTEYFVKTGNGDYYCIACKDGDPSREFIIKEDETGRASRLRRHLKRDHPVIYKQILDGESRRSYFPIPKMEFTGMTEERTLEMLLNHVYRTDLNFDIVKDQSMIQLFSYCAQRNCTLPSVKMLEEAAWKKYSEVKTCIQKLLSPVRKVSIPLDLCVKKTKIPVVGIRAHWVDDAWTLCHQFLGVVDVHCLDDEEADMNLADLLIETLKDFNLMDKVIAITTNHAKDSEEMMACFPKALKEMEASFDKRYHMPCLAHVLNQIDQEGLKQLGIPPPPSSFGFEDSDSLTRPCRVPIEITKNTIQVFTGLLGDAVHATLGSPESKALYKKLCEDLLMLEKRNLHLGATKDWTSTYKVYSEAWKKRHFLDEEAIETMNSSEDNISLASEDWEFLRSNLCILSPFNYCVKLLRNSKTFSASIVVRTLETLLSMTDSHMKELDKLSSRAFNVTWGKELLAMLKGMYTTMKEKLTQFDNSLKSSPAFAIAVMLDPQMKLNGSPSIQRGLVYKKMIRLLKKVVKQETTSSLDAPAQQTEMDLFDGTVLEGKNDIDETFEDSQPNAKKPKISVQDELDEYLQEACIVDQDPLSWWRQTGCWRFPRLAVLARDFLSICPVSTSFPRMFEAGLKTVPCDTDLESALLLMTLKCWLWEEDFRMDLDGLSDDWLGSSL